MGFVTRTEGELTNLFIPGYWSHCAVYVGGGFVMEAIGKGVAKTDLTDFLMGKDHAMILRPLFANDAQMAKAAAWSLTQEGLPYDYEFEGGSKKFYCAMLYYAALKVGMDGQSPFTLRETWGVQTVTPDDFPNAKDKIAQELLLPASPAAQTATEQPSSAA
jgi:uncharacterized protein YycO